MVKSLPGTGRAKQIRNDVRRYDVKNQDSPYAKALAESGLAQALSGKGEITNQLKFLWGDTRVLADLSQKVVSNRDRADLSMADSMGELLEESKKEVIIITPYFIPQKKGAQDLIDLEKNGTHLRILANSLSSNNHKMVHAHYAK